MEHPAKPTRACEMAGLYGVGAAQTSAGWGFFGLKTGQSREPCGEIDALWGSLTQSRENRHMAARRFHGLDGLRGICALTVVLFHADNLFHKGPIFQHGFLAVDMFFLLSGFVIAFVHETRLQAGCGLGRFVKARGHRLLPIYWLGAAFNLAIFLWMASAGYYPGYGWVLVWIVVPVTTLLMLPAFGAPDGSYSPAVMNVSWSLLAEWLVNIVYAAFAFRFRTRTLVFLTLAGWLAMGFVGYFTGRGWCVGFQFLPIGLLHCAPTFLAGVVIYRLRNHPWLARLPAIAPELLFTLWLCIAVVPTFTATPTFDWFAVTILCPAMMLLLLRSEHRAPAFCNGLGKLSYPLYTVHPGILLLAQKTPLFGLNHGPHIGRAVFVILLCIGAAWIVLLLADGLPRIRQMREPAKAVA